MSEKSLWRYLQTNMKGRWDACRHEDCVTIGVPDVSYGLHGVNGWIELKAMARYPKRKVLTNIPNLTTDQKSWLNRRALQGGSCWILLKAGSYFHLIDGAVVHRIGALPLADLASRTWHRSIDWDDFIYLITGGER